MNALNAKSSTEMGTTMAMASIIHFKLIAGKHLVGEIGGYLGENS